MKRPLLLLSAVAVTVAMLARSVTPVAACSCAQTPPEEHVATAGTILIGTVTEVKFDPPLSDPGPYEARRTIMVVAVERYLKGNGGTPVEVVERGIVVISSQDGKPWSAQNSSCALLHLDSVGQRWILFLPESSSPYTSSGLCSGSWRMDHPGAEEWVATVEQILIGPEELPETGGEPSGGGEEWQVPLAAALLSASAFGVALSWLRRGSGV